MMLMNAGMIKNVEKKQFRYIGTEHLNASYWMLKFARSLIQQT